MSFETIARRFISTALDVLAPQRCAACEELGPLASGYCQECGEPEALLDVACHIERVPVFAGARYADP
ncbi:MAG TPA: hypothetical protein VHW01_14210, partial [Polyangiaceae bacterium]|nr:hypothetical protein [Polyangiaceae bacterium]